MSRYSVVFISSLALLIVSPLALAAEEANKPEQAKPAFVISEMRVQKLPGPTVLYSQTQTTIGKISELAEKTIGAIEKAAAEAHAPVQGPVVFVYEGATAQPDQPFKLTIGLMVGEGAKDVGEYKVKKLSDFRCATVIYSGPMANVGEAATKLYSSLMAAGHKPTAEMREYYLYFEKPDSPNNIVLMQAGIQ